MIGRARLHRHVLDLDDLLRVRLADSEPPNTVKSLAKTNTVRPLTVPQPVTTPSPGILRLLHAELGRAVLDEHVELLERALVHQQLDALAGGELAALVLRLDARLAAAGARRRAALFELFEDVFHAQPPVDQPPVNPPLQRNMHSHARTGGNRTTWGLLGGLSLGSRHCQLSG